MIEEQEEKPVRLIIAYGNPGKRYYKSPNNAGFVVVDYATQKAAGIYPTQLTRNWEIRHKYMLLATNLDPFTFVAKPRTFENKFDDTAFSLYSFYRVRPEDFYVIYADRNVQLGYHSVERGLRDAPEPIRKVEKKVGDNFWSVRIGVAGTSDELTELDLTKLKYVGEKLADELQIVHNL